MVDEQSIKESVSLGKEFGLATRTYRVAQKRGKWSWHEIGVQIQNPGRKSTSEISKWLLVKLQ
jgi:hypothetical protein